MVLNMDRIVNANISFGKRQVVINVAGNNFINPGLLFHILFIRLSQSLYTLKYNFPHPPFPFLKEAWQNRIPANSSQVFAHLASNNLV